MTELDADGDTLFGLADLGCPELGSFSLEELTSIVLPFGMGIERDILFTGDFPISVWAEAPREVGSIRAAGASPSVLLAQNGRTSDAFAAAIFQPHTGRRCTSAQRFSASCASKESRR